jgi:hypothetical protein
MREGVTPLDPLSRGLLVLPPPLVLSSPFLRGTAATTLDESCSSVPRRPVEGRGGRSASTSAAEEEERLQRRREHGGGSSSGDGERLENGGVAVGDRGKGKESPRETEREMLRSQDGLQDKDDRAVL